MIAQVARYRAWLAETVWSFAAVVLAVRPEALVPGAGPVRGALEHVEDLGAELILHLPVGAERWAERSAAGTGGVGHDRTPQAAVAAFDPGQVRFLRKRLY